MKGSVLKKGLLVFAAAAAVQVGVSSMDASAAAKAGPIAAGNIKIDYENQKLIVSNSSTINVNDLQIYYGVATVKVVTKKVPDAENPKKKVTVKQNILSVASWDEYDFSNNMEIDLSTLNRAKDNYIQVKGSKEMTPITVKIPKVNTKVQAKFDAVAGTVVMNDITNKKAPVAMTDAKLEYRTNYSGWKAYSATEKLSVYQDRGATLYFRVKADTTAVVGAAVKTDQIRASWDAEEMDIYVGTGTFPGQEVKLAIGKRANAPAVTANYLTQRVNLPKTAEYRLVTAATTAAQLTTWTSVVVPEGTAAKVTTIPTEVSLAADTTLEVRTKATDTKPASKIKQFAFVAKEGVPVLKCTSGVTNPFLSTQKTTAAGKVDNTNGKPANAVAFIRKSDVVKNMVAADANTDLITAEYTPTYTNNKKTAYKSMKVTFTNNTSDAYEVVVADADAYTGTVVPASDVKGAITIAAGTTSKAGVFAPKKTAVAVKDGQLVFVRKKGVAAKKIWATDFVALGTVVFPPIEAAQ